MWRKAAGSGGMVLALVVCVVLGCLVLTGCGAKTQEKYPTRAIDLLVAWAPGGAADLAARATAGYLTNKWGVPVNVVNKTGGAGVVCLREAMAAQPDGYTLLFDLHSTSSMLYATQENLPWGLLDRTYVSQVADWDGAVFVVPSTSPWRTLRDAIESIKKDPSSFVWGYSGIGTVSTFAFASLFDAAGIDPKLTKAVPFKGGGESLSAVAGGHVQMTCQNLTSEVMGVLQSGKVQALALVGSKRSSLLPDVPTCAEVGFPQVKVPVWWGISGPKGLPDHVVKKWQDTIKAAVSDPSFTAELRKVNMVPCYRSGDEVKELVQKDYEFYKAAAERLAWLTGK